MGGFFGVVKRSKCVNDLFYGTDYNSHLGTKRAGLATVNGTHFSRSIHNIENAYFRNKFECELHEFTGNSGIGIISDTDAQPIVLNSKIGRFGIVTVAKINNLSELSQELLLQGKNFYEHTSESANPTEIVADIISQGENFIDGINLVFKKIKGSCSMLLLLDDGSIIAARDRLGRTPIIAGRHMTEEGSYALSSESCAFSNLGYEIAKNIGPGEIVRISSDKGIEQLQAPGDKMQICAFLWTYYGYPPCEYEGRNVDEMRNACGEEMGREDDTEIDFVSAIPDSGIGMALGYSVGKGVPYRRGISKYTPTWPRSFTPSSQERRELVAKMKLIVNKALLDGKRVAFCDDSIVRGTQLRDNVKDIRDAGATEVHVRISCPPLIYPCRFINFTNSKSEMELITRRVIQDLEGENPAPEILKEYAIKGTPRYERMVEEIRKRLDLTSLKFNSVDCVTRSIGLPRECICTHCFDGMGYE
ncbi:MAG: amidophosphoribosyltransferase [Muribaculaceae bacterium]|jgi:Glutamine phosphoribosylpyrophosphate amidotransferase|nr:amidophosphoribosyltransferase [Muribaculaceae bacterium]